MSTKTDIRSEATIRAITLPGLVFALSAVLGAHAVLGAPTDRSIRHDSMTSRLVASASNPIFDAGGLIAIAGAAVLLVAWLQRQGLRALVRARRPIPLRVRSVRADRAAQSRKQSISHHIGGLHGP